MIYPITDFAAVQRLLPLCTCLVLVMSGAAAAADGPLVDVGDTAPPWELLDGLADGLADGEQEKTVRFPADAHGAPSVILFWATWCPYCKALMPYLEQIRERYADRGVQVFAINIKEDGDPVTFLRKAGYKFRLGLHGDTIATDYGVKFAPGLLVVDGDGVVQFRRRSTRLPPGKKIAEHWAEQVQAALEKSFAE